MFTKTLLSRILLAFGALVVMGGLVSSDSPSTPPKQSSPTATTKEEAKPAIAQPVITTKELPVREDIPFQTVTKDDGTLDLGQRSTTQKGTAGIKETVYTVTYTDGAETSKVLKSVSTITEPINEIVAVGSKTYSAPPARTQSATTSAPTTATQTTAPTSTSTSTGSGYVNVDGNYVQSPAYSSTVPADASAQCKDGTYSYSQHRQGTCSGHGGVASWL